MAVPTIELRPLSLKKIEPLSNILIIGKRNSGKSTLVCKLIKHMVSGYEDGHRESQQKLKTCVVMSGSERFNSTYRDVCGIRPDYICDGFCEQFLRVVVDKAKQRAAKYGSNHPSAGVMIIFDDLAFDKKFFDNKLVQEIIFNGRHINVCFVVIVQNPISWPAHYRGNMDWIFTAREREARARKNLYEMYFGAFENEKQFKEVIDRVTTNRTFMVASVNADGEKPIDIYFAFNSMQKLPKPSHEHSSAVKLQQCLDQEDEELSGGVSKHAEHKRKRHESSGNVGLTSAMGAGESNDNDGNTGNNIIKSSSRNRHHKRHKSGNNMNNNTGGGSEQSQSSCDSDSGSANDTDAGAESDKESQSSGGNASQSGSESGSESESQSGSESGSHSEEGSSEDDTDVDQGERSKGMMGLLSGRTLPQQQLSYTPLKSRHIAVNTNDLTMADQSDPSKDSYQLMSNNKVVMNQVTPERVDDKNSLLSSIRRNFSGHHPTKPPNPRQLTDTGS